MKPAGRAASISSSARCRSARRRRTLVNLSRWSIGRLALARAPAQFDPPWRIEMNEDDITYENSITVHAPPAAVYEALTSADKLQCWFPTRVETDPRAGGSFKFAWDFAESAQNGTQQGKFLDVVAGKKVSYT